MKKIAILLTMISMCSTQAIAQDTGFVDPNAAMKQTAPMSDGFRGPSTGVTTVAKAKTMWDDSWVTLRGNIEKRIGGEHYIFRDATGTMVVDIDHKYWYGLTITPQDTVELHGEIDRDWNSVELDVKQITKVK
ncbi:YgiW/YdeI family stress tolerance OB fold protein [Yersinia enterocolitica]|uniref:YgiW/YdeI family stress tolerance OB fold protein n=1 Tax=Yersinia enterocolitica TaxID=630 RepID=UPI003AB879FC